MVFPLLVKLWKGFSLSFFFFFFGLWKGTSYPLASSKHELYELASLGKSRFKILQISLARNIFQWDCRLAKGKEVWPERTFSRTETVESPLFPLVSLCPSSGSPFLEWISQPSSEKMVSQRQSDRVHKDMYSVTSCPLNSLIFLWLTLHVCHEDSYPSPKSNIPN